MLTGHWRAIPSSFVISMRHDARDTRGPTTASKSWTTTRPRRSLGFWLCRCSEQNTLSKSVSTPRHHALQMFRAAVQAVDPSRAVLDHVSFDGRVLDFGLKKAGRKRYDLSAFDRIHVIGAGKASA